MHVPCAFVMLLLVATLWDQVHTGKIIGGEEATPHSRPYMVLLTRNFKNGNTKFCGGFLISEDFVMTAAHCHADSFKVSLGLHDYREDKDVQKVFVDQEYPRKDYNETRFQNDIMLLKLSTKAKLSKYVRPIALAPERDGSLPKSCSVSGWGRTENSEKMSDILKVINITLVTNEMCEDEKLYCSEGPKGPGKGDSGGPLVCEGEKAYGVVSSTFVPKNGGASIHGFAKIPYKRKWIDLVMKYNGNL